MAKLAKLYAKLVQSPKQIITFRDFERMIAAFGFVLKRERGSHKSYRHPRVREVLTVQPVGKDAEPYQVRRFMDIVAEFGLEIDT
ncbi:MAG TPA: type II toxin-antitoxin system HicA family toxin [Allosphingosinicella sp.]|nr:type II toxin-antitoxin system HicA family toxin [Allosphingosinicella sp.]